MDQFLLCELLHSSKFTVQQCVCVSSKVFLLFQYHDYSRGSFSSIVLTEKSTNVLAAYLPNLPY